MACKNKKKAHEADVYAGVDKDMADHGKTTRKLEREATATLDDNSSMGHFDYPVGDPAVPSDAL